MAVILEEKKIRAIFKESVKEAMDAQMIKLGAFLIPHMSAKEQKNITKLYRAPSRKAEKSYKAEL